MVHPAKVSIEEWNERYKEDGLFVRVLKQLKSKKWLLECDQGHQFKRVYLGNRTGCPICSKNQRFSLIHRKLADWIERQGIKAKHNYRKLIPPKEVDIYFPKQKIALEVDGIHWHSEKYHGDWKKRLERRQLLTDKGVRLLRFWDHELLYKASAVLSFLKSTLGENKYRVGARECTIRPISTKRSRKFLDTWHLQGHANASVRLGLYYGKKLVSVMTFRRPSISKSYDWELARYAVKGDWSIAGGASKLFKAFLEEKGSDVSVVSYADRRYSEGNLYGHLGFKLVHVSKPGYFYFRNHQIISRYQAQKHKLPELLGDAFDPGLSESDNMAEAGYAKVYDCGQLVFAYGSTKKEVRVPVIDVPQPKSRVKMTWGEVKNRLPKNLEVLTGGADNEPCKRKGEYHTFRCTCGNVFESLIGTVLRARENGCHKCANRLDIADILDKLQKNNPGVEYIGGYSGAQQPATFRIKGTNIEFQGQANLVLAGRLPRDARAQLRQLPAKQRQKILLSLNKYRT